MHPPAPIPRLRALALLRRRRSVCVAAARVAASEKPAHLRTWSPSCRSGAMIVACRCMPSAANTRPTGLGSLGDHVRLWKYRVEIKARTSWTIASGLPARSSILAPSMEHSSAHWSSLAPCHEPGVYGGEFAKVLAILGRLDQQPVSEGRNLWQVCGRLRCHDPVGRRIANS